MLGVLASISFEQLHSGVPGCACNPPQKTIIPASLSDDAGLPVSCRGFISQQEPLTHLSHTILCPASFSVTAVFKGPILSVS